MKTSLTLALLALGALQIDTTAWAQGRPQGRPQAKANTPAPAPSVDNAPDEAVLQALLETYDANKNGRLDRAERELIHADIESGKLDLPEGTKLGRGPGHGHGPLPPELLEQYDTDKDGHLNDVEKAVLDADIKSGKITPPVHQPPAEILAKYDVNKDGKIDESEHAAIEADIKSGALVPPARPLPKAIVDLYDANKDGKLDETEHAALKADVEAGKIQLPAGRPGRRGGRN